jgi:hypothetical protein
MTAVRHGLLVLVEEHFQFPSRRGGVAERHWDRFPPRVAANVRRALATFARHRVTATFVVGGWIAARHPSLVEDIAAAGHVVRRLPHQGGVGLPAGSWGGARLRLWPERLVARHIRRWVLAPQPRALVLRAWEFDAETPPLAMLTRVERLLCHHNLAAFSDRLGRLLGAAAFGPAQAVALGGASAAPQRAAAGRRSAAARPVAATPAGSTGAPVTVVVPCYNEETGLPYLARALDALGDGFGRRHPLSFVLVDDGSRDATWPEMQRLFGGRADVTLVRHPANRGIGAAVLTGIGAARDEVIAVMDSDCSYDPARIEDMLPLLAPDVALVTASPYHPQGGVEGVPEWRLFLSRGASALYRVVLRNKLATYTSCFRVCRRSAFDGLVLRHEGYIGIVEMLARLDLAGWRVVEHPVVLEARVLGQSKLRILRAIGGHLRFLGEISFQRLIGRQDAAAGSHTG